MRQTTAATPPPDSWHRIPNGLVFARTCTLQQAARVLRHVGTVNRHRFHGFGPRVLRLHRTESYRLEVTHRGVPLRRMRTLVLIECVAGLAGLVELPAPLPAGWDDGRAPRMLQVSGRHFAEAQAAVDFGSLGLGQLLE